MSRRERTGAAFGDMVRTLAIFAILIGATIAFIPRKHHDRIQPIDYANDLAIFAKASTFNPEVPTPMPAGWQVTSFTATAPRDGSASSLHMGIVTTTVHYAAIEETDAPTDAFRLKVLGVDRVGDGTIYVNGLAWERFSIRKVDSLVRTQGIVTTVLTGGATLEELKTLAATLKLAR